VNAFLVLHQGETTILVNYFNALSFTAAGEKTVVLLAADTFVTVDESIDEIERMIHMKAVWAK
jgi:hypothetical protein